MTAILSIEVIQRYQIPLGTYYLTRFENKGYKCF